MTRGKAVAVWWNGARTLGVVLASLAIGLVSLYLAVLFGIEILSVLEDNFCPDGPYGADCTAPSWRSRAIEVYLAVFAGVSAVVAVYVPTVLAPSQPFIARVLVLILGGSAALSVSLAEDAFLPSALSAICCGAVAAWVFSRKLGARGDESNDG